MIEEKKDLIIAILTAVGMWSVIAAIAYFVVIPAVITSIALSQQQALTQETLTDSILKASLIAIPMAAIYYLVMKKILYRSNV